MGSQGLIDNDVSNRFFKGDRCAVTDALNQIHWRSLKIRGGLNWEAKEKISTNFLNRTVQNETTYLDALVGKRDPDKEANLNTNRLSEVTNLFRVYSSTIFPQTQPLKRFGICSKIVKKYWILYCLGKGIKNQRFGFVQTTSVEEAGLIIVNAKEKGGLSSKIRMTINNQFGYDHKGINSSEIKQTPSHKTSPQTEKDKEKVQGFSIGKKMFQYTEAVVDEEIEKGLFQIRIGFSKAEEKSNVLQNKLD